MLSIAILENPQEPAHLLSGPIISKIYNFLITAVRTIPALRSRWEQAFKVSKLPTLRMIKGLSLCGFLRYRWGGWGIHARYIKNCLCQGISNT
jgi:hypothetical protein